MCQATESAVPTTQADDERVRVTRWDFAPGAATGFHVHEYPYVVTYLTDAKLKIVDPQGAESFVEMQAGGSYSRPKGIAHDVINAGAAPMAFVEVEIKIGA
ncbi:cupin domain-containing protein [Ferrovibrio terrae]|uniref:Cupin domain-containing protein n=1 Tax=Ferrovibrio terrae TaxID=2594003 RepID=A0A516H362_9PROT|nr:cupin domain-containing protein [Ferrovibrio terrae]QDO98213.1 cupin domain-containing protein [Ferrovibrio terrae]